MALCVEYIGIRAKNKTIFLNYLENKNVCKDVQEINIVQIHSILRYESVQLYFFYKILLILLMNNKLYEP